MAGDGRPLLDAARHVVEEWLAADHGIEVVPTALAFTSAIPRQVGLAGSSAIVIGVVEALAELHGVEPEPTTVAQLALRAEVDVLGIVAGPQDRVVQAHRGVLDMDFAEAWDPTRYQRLPETALGALVVAWHPEPGMSSGVVHGDLRSRWESGDPVVHEVMSSLAALAGEAADLLRRGRSDALAPVIDDACRLRRRLWTFSANDERLLAVADDADAAATLAGSGGAVVAIPRSGAGTPAQAASLCAAFENAGLRALVPRPQPGFAPSVQASGSDGSP
jgi:glucuronokinase